jgi:hypothetical protein
VAREFFDHAEPEDRLFYGMVQNMKPDQAGIKVPVIVIEFRVCSRFRQSIMYYYTGTMGQSQLKLAASEPRSTATPKVVS